MAELEFKIILVGDAGVGKSTMVAGLIGDPLPKTYVQTQGTVIYTDLQIVSSQGFCNFCLPPQSFTLKQEKIMHFSNQMT